MQMPSPQDPQKVYLLAIPLFHVTGNATYLHLCEWRRALASLLPQSASG